jgi:hypothetical protein
MERPIVYGNALADFVVAAVVVVPDESESGGSAEW